MQCSAVVLRIQGGSGVLVWGFLGSACLCTLASGCQCLVVLPRNPDPFFGLSLLACAMYLFVCPGSDFVFAARSSSAPSLGGQTLGPGAGTVPGSVGSGLVLGLCLWLCVGVVLRSGCIGLGLM